MARRELVRFGSLVAVLLAACAATTGVLTSCSSDDPAADAGAGDSGLEGSVTADGAVSDGGPVDPPPRDAAPFDGGPLPVVCGSSPCATSLVTTTSLADDQEEGFCALLSDGTVACWGANGLGQLGRGDDAGVAGSVKPARVVGLSDVVRLEHTCALDKSGATWCWGQGAYLRTDAGGLTTEPTPVQLPLPPATAISVGGGVGCVLSDGGVLCWGSNARGQLAPSDTAPPEAELPPTEIVIPPGAPLRSVAVGEATFVLREDGTALSWGARHAIGRMSSLSPDSYPKPVGLTGVSSIDLTISLGKTGRACATAAGIGYCWTGRAGYQEGALAHALPRPVVASEPLVQIATAEQGRWCAVGASGSVYCWGLNSSGQAGDGTKEYAYEAVKVEGLPAPAAEVRTTPSSTCALLTNGKVYCFGANSFGQLGSGMYKVPSLVPKEVVLP